MNINKYTGCISHTGYCWQCGKVIDPYMASKIIEVGFDSFMFCTKKHQELYDKKQDGAIKKGKRAGYGLAGSTH